jgi:hypothetical protein
MVWLPEEGLTLPLLARQADDWILGYGRLKPAPRVGSMTFTRSDPGATPKALFGPTFDCRTLSVWETGEGSPVDVLALGRDLGKRRLDTYPGHGLMGYLAPKWQDALRAYLPAILEGDVEALHELVDLIELPAKGAVGRELELTLIRLRRQVRKVSDQDAYERILEEILDCLSFWPRLSA